MYGFIHCCLEDLVIKMFGEETWKEILKRSGVKLRGASFLIHKVYSDEVTMKLISTTSEVVGLDIETCLEAFGDHFLKYCQKNGYDKILRVLGSNLYEFLTNLDNLHDQLSSVYPGMKAPSFRVTNTSEGSLHLHYFSERKGLSAIVRGLVRIVSKEFFNTEVVVKVVEECSDGHVILEVVRKEDNASGTAEIFAPFMYDKHLSTKPKDLPFSSRTICEAFPFHMIFDKEFKIIQSGDSLKRLSNTLCLPNKCPKFIDLFVITRPMIESTFESILNYCNQVFVVKSTDKFISVQSLKSAEDMTTEELPNLRLKGQMVPLPESDAILFLCSPRVTGLDEMLKLGLYMTDIPVHDRTRDLILMSHQRRGERELVEKLDEATNHIKILETKLRDENKRTEGILHNIFPAKIARMLCQNIRVEPKSFESVTCLFSDIVGFTSMCGSPCVEPMDVVRLLNRLYIQFDNLTNIYGVYKVETIGDAYVVVGGLPELCTDHADRVIQMGLAMVKVTYNVMSPVDGKHIQMRIGIHSGACIAGIVGLAMPRYCLFGNTVTLANKMESSSTPGQVHISDETKRRLIRDNYIFSDCIENVFSFPTYFVTKLDGNYGEDCSLSVHNNLITTGGHFKSPSGSPTHTPKDNSRAESPASETPLSPPGSPTDYPQKKTSLSDIFMRNLRKNSVDIKHFNVVETQELPDVQISEPTSDLIFKTETDLESHPIETTKMSETIENTVVNKSRQISVKSSSSLTKDKRFLTNRVLCEPLDLAKTGVNSSDVIISEENISKNVDSNVMTEKIVDQKRGRKRYFVLFCFGHKKHKNTIKKIRPKHVFSAEQNANIKCIKSNVTNDRNDRLDDISKHSDSSNGMTPTTSQTNASAVNNVDNVNVKPRRHHRLCCLTF